MLCATMAAGPSCPNPGSIAMLLNGCRGGCCFRPVAGPWQLPCVAHVFASLASARDFSHYMASRVRVAVWLVDALCRGLGSACEACCCMKRARLVLNCVSVLGREARGGWLGVHVRECPYAALWPPIVCVACMGTGCTAARTAACKSAMQPPESIRLHVHTCAGRLGARMHGQTPT